MDSCEGGLPGHSLPALGVVLQAPAITPAPSWDVHKPSLPWAQSQAARCSWPKPAPPHLEGEAPLYPETGAQQALCVGPTVTLHPRARLQLLGLASQDETGVAGGDHPVQMQQAGSGPQG